MSSLIVSKLPSPFFKIVEHPALAWRVAYVPPVPPEPGMSPFEIAKAFQTAGGTPLETRAGPPLQVIGESIALEDCQKVLSVEEAEDIFLNLIPSEEAREYDLSDLNEFNSIGVVLSRHANLIASRTRKGAANVCLTSSKVLNHMVLSGAPIESLEPEIVGRWAKVAKLNNVIPIYVSDLLPEDEALMVYFFDRPGNLIDGPGGVVRDDQLYLYVMKDSPNGLGNALDHMSRVRFKGLM